MYNNNGPVIRIYSSLPSNRTNRSWDARRTWWRPTLDSTLPATRRWPNRRASRGSVCLIALPKALTVDASRKNAGSAMARNGGPDARGGSAGSNGDTDSIGADTKDRLELGAGLDSVGSQALSST